MKAWWSYFSIFVRGEVLPDTSHAVAHVLLRQVVDLELFEQAICLVLGHPLDVDPDEAARSEVVRDVLGVPDLRDLPGDVLEGADHARSVGVHPR